jgi:hypothetical protein
MNEDGYYVNSQDIRYALVNPPEGVSIDPVTGVVSFRADTAGTYTLTLKTYLVTGETVDYGSGSNIYKLDATFTTTVPVTVE